MNTHQKFKLHAKIRSSCPKNFHETNASYNSYENSCLCSSCRMNFLERRSYTIKIIVKNVKVTRLLKSGWPLCFVKEEIAIAMDIYSSARKKNFLHRYTYEQLHQSTCTWSGECLLYEHSSVDLILIQTKRNVTDQDLSPISNLQPFPFLGAIPFHGEHSTVTSPQCCSFTWPPPPLSFFI